MVDYSYKEAEDRREMWHCIFGKNPTKAMKRKFAEEYGLKPHDITWDWCLEHKLPSEKPIDLCKVWPEPDDYSDDFFFEEEEDEMNTAAKYVNCAQPVISFSTIASTDMWAVVNPNQEKDIKIMGYEYNMEVDQRNHLKRRLENVQCEKAGALATKFHIGERHPAKTKDEVLAALARGEVTMPDYLFNKDGTLRGDYFVEIYLKNPAEDKAGYESAKTLMGKAYTAAKDAIIVKPLADGLAALNEFEKAEF